MVAQVGYLVAEQWRGWVTPCAVCTVHEETRSASFWLSLKTNVDGFLVVWYQKHSDGFLQFDLKISGNGFLRFALKTGGVFLG
jgi:hypothetical protein